MSSIVITHVSVKRELREALVAFVEVEVNQGLIIRDLKIIRHRGKMFLSWPGRAIRRARACPCGVKSLLDHRHCHGCGVKLSEREADPNGAGPTFSDVVQPKTPADRMAVYRAVREAAHQAGIYGEWREYDHSEA